MVVSAPSKERLESLPKTKQKSWRWLTFLAMTIVLQVVALLFTEFFLYVAGLGEEEIYAFDKDLGTKHMTNKRITWRSEGYGRTYFDGEGMQEPGLTIAKPANTYRIAVLGDSTVEGLQVPAEAQFTRVLNEQIKLNSGKKVQVLNFGTSGYSTVQELIQLKKQVLRYAPDMVVLCYDTRDLFENWSSPDETMTNLRPVALKVPGKDLIIHNAAVTQWMKSPRGRFLTSIGWLRQNSRIWGLISATETELSFKNEVYKTIVGLLTSPANTVRKLWKQASIELSKPDNWSLNKIFTGSSGPSFHIQFFEGKDPNAQSGGTNGLNSREVNSSSKGAAVSSNTTSGEANKDQAAAQTSVKQNSAPLPAHVQSSITKINSNAAKSALSEAGEKANNEIESTAARPKIDAATQNFVALLTNTLTALIEEMNKTCRDNKVKFVVVALPSRIGVAPAPGEQTVMLGVSYSDEVEVVKKACANDSIPFYNLVTPALQVPETERHDMFFAVHLSAKGHKFIARQLSGFLSEQANKAPENQ